MGSFGRWIASLFSWIFLEYGIVVLSIFIMCLMLMKYTSDMEDIALKTERLHREIRAHHDMLHEGNTGGL